MTNSERFHWCSGCGKWHNNNRKSGMHYAMYCPWTEPNEKNFEGTTDDLERFNIARQLRQEDEKIFESRIDERIVKD